MSLKYRYQNFQVGKYEISLRLLRDIDQFSDPDGAAADAHISRAAWPLFGLVWASSEVMAHLMLDHDIEDKRILEIGCGMALVSHLLNAKGADISAMDIHPIVGEFIADNAILNRAPAIPFYNTSWSDEPDLGTFDLIIGSDVLYEPKHVKHLARFMTQHTHNESEVLILDPDRGQGDRFYTDMVDLGYNCELFRPKAHDHLGIEFNGQGYRYFRA